MDPEKEVPGHVNVPHQGKRPHSAYVTLAVLLQQKAEHDGEAGDPSRRR